MSRNFELLQKLGKEQEMINAGESSAAAAPAPRLEQSEPVAAVPVESTSAPSEVWSPPKARASALPASEPVVALAQQIFIAPGTEAPRSVVFASTEPGAGCSWVSARTAQALADRVAGSICVIDANFTDPLLHEFFHVPIDAGLAEALVEPVPIRQFARPTGQANLWLITAGSPNADALIASDRMRLRIAELRAEFDFVLIDSAAMSINNDAIALGSFSDGVVLVLKAHASKRTSAKQAVEEMQSGKAKVLGAVLNQRRYPIPQRIYDWL